MYLRQYILEFMCVSSLFLKSNHCPSARVSKTFKSVRVRKREFLFVLTHHFLTLEICFEGNRHGTDANVVLGSTYMYCVLNTPEIVWI
jgi:hypothetical protein